MSHGGAYRRLLQCHDSPNPGEHGYSPIEAAQPTIVKDRGSGTYPATEREVFTFREGAFYGNLFEPEALSWNCEISDDKRTCTHIDPTNPKDGIIETCGIRAKTFGDYNTEDLPQDSDGYSAETARTYEDVVCVETKAVPYRNVYACYSLAQQQDSQDNGDDGEGVAFLNDRICDEPDPNKRCFFHTPRRCHFLNAQKNENRGAHCDWVDGVYQNCKSSDGKLTYLPITTYLNDPCDLIGNDDLCSKVRRSLVLARLPATKVVPGPHGCGGCSLGDAGGGFLPASIAALLALLRRGRMRRRTG